ncbi:MAG: CNNM domain-containing protein [Cellvibrionaceae bacterium]
MITYTYLKHINTLKALAFSFIPALTFVVIPSAAWAVGGPVSNVEPSDNAAFLLVFYVLLALLTSFLCSIAEAVLLSITPSYIETLKTKKPSLAKKLTALKLDNVDRSLAAILTLNTIAHTVGAIGAGAQATAVFGSAWFGVFSAVMTLMVLVLSEIIPKTIGAVYWQQLAKPTVWYVNALVKSLLPLVWLSEQLTKLIARDKPTHAMSREEFLAMAHAGKATGQIYDNESRIIKNLLQLNLLKVTDVMTPSTVIAALPEDTLVIDAVEQFRKQRFSRWPIYCNDLNDITGFILRSEILLSHAEKKSNTATLKDLKRDILHVPTSATVEKLLEMFLRERLHIAVVTDEHGGTRGLITLEDLIETLIGVEIMDEVDTVEDMRAFASKQWQKRVKDLDVIEPESRTKPEQKPE